MRTLNVTGASTMKIPRMSMITLGVTDLGAATAFYGEVLAVVPNTKHAGVAFIELPGVWLGLYPLDKLAEDASPGMSSIRSGFAGFTLAHNAKSRADVDAIHMRAAAAGARVVKPPQATFWGGYHFYFTDMDGFYWEVAHGDMFDFDACGTMQWKS